VCGGELTVIGPAAPDPLLAPATLQPVGEHTFRVESKDGYGIPDELAVFEVDATERMTRVRFGENYTERIETWEDAAGVRSPVDLDVRPVTRLAARRFRADGIRGGVPHPIPVVVGLYCQRTTCGVGEKGPRRDPT